ncbi:AT-hook motif nuclear-localized protein 9 [Lycium ferocissimum]|uniref:AT-hook motif nuclear-localized protein 9 n=1 Tax=Lycium ferocissimum TaxID=112874 RepID=UPI00281601A8|nr:AT-hook motif nuclear-localized protein 9 [Lycium ferocissimum]XP_059312694.1 AT-hook motif nuclear-localized protein 9 [Lycium ferocissimum]
MDRRDAMMLPGSAPYYMQRGMSGSGSGSTPGLQGSPSINPSLPTANIAFQSSSIGASSASIPQTLLMDPSSTLSPRGSIGASSSALPQGEPVRRKRGRPRKYGVQGAMPLTLNPPPSTQAMALNPTQKRGRGRPPGSGRKQQLASFGGWLSNIGGIGFTPHVITIAVGEDITAKIMSFSQQGPRSICILSANGVVSTVTLRQPSTSGGTVTYEGRFEILCLSGSFLVSDSGGSRGRIGGLSVSLASPDGRVIGGGVGGVLIAASPIQVIVGSFLCSSSKAKKIAAESVQSAGTSDLQTTDNSVNPVDVLSNQNLTPSSSMGVWPSSRQMDLQTGHIDIDLMRG